MEYGKINTYKPPQSPPTFLPFYYNKAKHGAVQWFMASEV